MVNYTSHNFFYHGFASSIPNHAIEDSMTLLRKVNNRRLGNSSSLCTNLCVMEFFFYLSRGQQLITN